MKISNLFWFLPKAKQPKFEKPKNVGTATTNPKWIMSKSSQEEFPFSLTQKEISTIMTDTNQSLLASTTGQQQNVVLMPTTETSSQVLLPSGVQASPQQSVEKQSQKKSLKSKVSPEEILESQTAAQGLKILHLKKSDLDAFAQMIKEYEEIINSTG
jgi:hypothetical protein